MWVQGPVIFDDAFFVADDDFFVADDVEVEVDASVNVTFVTALRLLCAPELAADWLTAVTR